MRCLLKNPFLVWLLPLKSIVHKLFYYLFILFLALLKPLCHPEELLGDNSTGQWALILTEIFLKTPFLGIFQTLN